MSTIVSLNTFGGMTNDGHDPSTSASLLSSHFDISTRPHRLTPHRSSEDGNPDQNTEQLANFAYGNGNLYALGISTGAVAKLFGTSAIDTPSWFVPGSDIDTNNGTRAPSFFVFYHDQVYGAAAGTYLWQYDIGSASMTTPWQSLSHTTIAQGLVHSQDDILYIPYDNKIATWDGSSFTSTGLELPSSLVITGICEYGNYLAIACRPVSGIGNSRVFLWDRDASLATVSENIDWGEGWLVGLGAIQGTLVGISLIGVSTSVQSKIVFKSYTTNGAVMFQQLALKSDTLATTSFVGTQEYNDGLYFCAALTLSDGTFVPGIWSITGNASSGFSVVHEYAPDNDTVFTLGDFLLEGFVLVGGFAYIAYENNGTHFLSKTDDQNNYATIAVRQTTINQGMPVADRARLKRLEAVSLSYIPLPPGASATLKYRVDGGDWISVFTETTVGATATEMTVAADGTAFTDGRNFEFRIESSGGAEISEVKCRYDPIETNL